MALFRIKNPISNNSGILEPAGIVDVKFKKERVKTLIKRCDAEVLRMQKAITALERGFFQNRNFVSLSQGCHREFCFFKKSHRDKSEIFSGVEGPPLKVLKFSKNPKVMLLKNLRFQNASLRSSAMKWRKWWFRLDKTRSIFNTLRSDGSFFPRL